MIRQVEPILKDRLIPHDIKKEEQDVAWCGILLFFRAQYLL